MTTPNLPRSSGTPYERETVSAFAATTRNGDVVVEAVFGNEFSENHVPLTLDAARVLRNKLDAAIRTAEQSMTTPTTTRHPFRATELVPGWCVRCGEASWTEVHQRVIAWDREERDPCQAGTPGCSVDHDRDHGSCETW